MENKKYLDEKKYQKTKRILNIIASLLVIIGLSIGIGSKIAKNADKPSETKIAELKGELESEKSKLEVKVTESLAAEKKKLEDKKNELTAKGVKYNSMAEYDEGEVYDLKIVTKVLDPSFDYCAFDEYKNNSLTQNYCAILNKQNEDSKNLSIITATLDSSFDYCGLDEYKNNSYIAEYCTAVNTLDEYERGINSTSPGALFACFACIMIAIPLFFYANARNMLAFQAQQTIPVAKEGINEMAPTMGNAAHEIAKGIKDGLKDEDDKK